MSKNNKVAWIALAFSAALVLPATNSGAQVTTNNTQCCSAVDQALESVAHIKKDATRAEVEKEFKQDGGLYSREQTIYIYKKCPAIKIRVTFSLDPEYKGFADGSPKDTVQSVSKPYLEYPVKD